MTVTARATPRARTCTWDAVRTWQASVTPPAQIATSDLPMLARQLGLQLADGIGGEVAKEPVLQAR